MNFWTGEACYVRGAKMGGFGRIWATIVTYVRSQRLQACDHTSNTFLVLGPIDLTNGRAVVVGHFPSTLRGMVKE